MSLSVADQARLTRARGRGNALPLTSPACPPDAQGPAQLGPAPSYGPACSSSQVPHRGWRCLRDKSPAAAPASSR